MNNARPSHIVRLARWIDERLPVLSWLDAVLCKYPMPLKAKTWGLFGWLGVLLGAVLFVTGLFLAIHYRADTAHAFASVQAIMRDVDYGWLLRGLHANGASFLFGVTYIHLFRCLYYRSYRSPREIVWITGVILLCAMMGLAFTGYVMVFGQMSLWGGTVITGLFKAFPVIGQSLTETMRGSADLSGATLRRMYVLHFLSGFVFLPLTILHIWAARVARTRRKATQNQQIPAPAAEDIPARRVPFHPYYSLKLARGFLLLCLLLAVAVFFFPDALTNPDNRTPANPLSTPPELMPEWYLLPYYGILRSVEHELAGVLLMFGAVGVLFFVPFLDNPKRRSPRMRKLHRALTWLWLADCVLLGYLATVPVFGAARIVGLVATVWYFAHFVVVLPLLNERGPQ